MSILLILVVKPCFTRFMKIQGISTCLFWTMAGSHRGYMMLSRSKARMQEAENLIPFHCFKCKFFTTSKNFINKHMTLQHMMGRAEIDLPDLFIKCFKCSFSSREGVDIDKHMTISHLMGEKTKAEMEKYVKLSIYYWFF